MVIFQAQHNICCCKLSNDKRKVKSTLFPYLHPTQKNENLHLSHLPANNQAEIGRIKDALIPKYAEIEMIILFGSHAHGDWKIDRESIL